MANSVAFTDFDSNNPGQIDEDGENHIAIDSDEHRGKYLSKRNVIPQGMGLLDNREERKESFQSARGKIIQKKVLL